MSDERGVGESGQDRRLEGWGGNEHPDLTDEQAAGLQEREEPVADANFGGAFSGDLGNAEVADESSEVPETEQPDTSIGHEGGQRYEQYANGGGASA